MSDHFHAFLRFNICRNYRAVPLNLLKRFLRLVFVGEESPMRRNDGVHAGVFHAPSVGVRSRSRPCINSSRYLNLRYTIP
jgi:hypothetical protein